MQRNEQPSDAQDAVTHLLVDVSTSGTPSVRRIGTGCPIYGRLTVDRQVPQPVHLCQLLINDRRFL